LTDKSKLARAIDEHKLQCVADLAEMTVTLARAGCELSQEEARIIVGKHYTGQDQVTGFYVWLTAPEGQQAFLEALREYKPDLTAESDNQEQGKIKKEVKELTTKKGNKETKGDKETKVKEADVTKIIAKDAQIKEAKVTKAAASQEPSAPEIKVEFMRNPLVAAGVFDELKAIMKKESLSWSQLVQKVVKFVYPKVTTQEQLLAMKGSKSWKQFELELIAATFPESKLLAKAVLQGSQVQAQASTPSTPEDQAPISKGKKSKAGSKEVVVPDDDDDEFPDEETVPVLPSEEI